MYEFAFMVGGWAASYLVRSAVLLAVLGAVAWMTDRLLRRVGPAAQHRMWVAALMAGVLVPLLPSGWMPQLHHAGTVAGGPVTVTYRMITAATERWTASSALWAAVGVGYLLLVLFCLTRLVWHWRQTAGLARRSTKRVPDARSERLLKDATCQAGVTLPMMYCSAETHGPVVLGLGRPLLIVPERFFEAADADIAAALSHECAHMARRDYAKNLLYEFARGAVAYHPAAWLMRRRIAETRELICDELAAERSGNRPEYAASLLRLAQSMAAPAMRTSHAIGVFDGDILEERIMRLTTDVAKMSTVRKIAIVAATAGAMLSGALAAVALPVDVGAKNESQEKIYKVGGDVTPPKLIYSVDAEFPESKRKAEKVGWHGVSVLELVVDSTGLPRDIRVRRSLSRDFDRCAMDAVRQYKFEPAMHNGKPVAVAITIEVNFQKY